MNLATHSVDSPWLKRFVLAALFGLLAACAGRSGVSPDDVEVVSDWDGIENLTRVENVYVASQPNADALRAAGARDVGVVLNLRNPSEDAGFDEQAVAEAAGLEYFQIPIMTSGGLDKDAMVQISQIVNAAGSEPILVHCASGNRVSGWLAVHLARNRGMTVEEALSVARAAGLTKTGLESMVKTTLETTE